MKKFILSLLSVLICLTLFAENEKTVSSKIKKVTVFTQGAQVSRSAKVYAPKGITRFVFSGLSNQMVTNSLQAKGRGNFIILDVQYRYFYPEPTPQIQEPVPEKIQKEIKALGDSLILIGFEEKRLTGKKDALIKEKNMLLASKLVNGQGKTDSLPLLKDALDLVGVRLAGINDQLVDLEVSQYSINKRKTIINSRLTELRNYQKNKPVVQKGPEHQIVVTVFAEYAVNGYIDVNYRVNGASWAPSYDLRAKNTKSPMTLTYKASITQNTGEDWDNVKIKLSTNNPNQGFYKPVMTPWYLALYQQHTRQKKYTTTTLSAVKASTEEDCSGSVNYDVAYTPVNFTTTNLNLTHVEFDINLSFSIPSDAKPHLLPVREEKLDAHYFHYAVPRLSKETFLIAKLTGWEDLDLLPAAANIFFEDTYVGQTNINPNIMNDTIEIALGKDPGIMIERKKTFDKEKDKGISSFRIKTVEYEITIRNNRSNTVNLIVQDQIPLSNNKNIKTQITKKSGGDYNKANGYISWRFKLNGATSKKLKIGYEIEYLKGLMLAAY